MKTSSDFRIIDEMEYYRIALFPDEPMGPIVRPGKEGLSEAAAYYYNKGFQDGKKESTDLINSIRQDFSDFVKKVSG